MINVLLRLFDLLIRPDRISYADSSGITSGPGIVPLGDITATVTRTIYGDDPGVGTKAQLTELLNSMPKSIKSNKLERTCLLEVLGYCGILCPAEQRHDTHHEVDWDHAASTQPDQFFKREWAYPVRWWEGQHGFKEDMIQYWFGSKAKG